jgi:hypothetical protein
MVFVGRKRFSQGEQTGLRLSIVLKNEPWGAASAARLAGDIAGGHHAEGEIAVNSAGRPQVIR